MSERIDLLEAVYRASVVLSKSIREHGFTGETWKHVDQWRATLRAVRVGPKPHLQAGSWGNETVVADGTRGMERGR